MNFHYISAVRDSQIVHEGHPLKFPIKEAIVSFGVVNLKAVYGFDFLERVEKITQTGSRFGTVIGDYQNELFICLDQENFAIPISEHVIATNDTKTEFTEASFSISTLYFYLNQYGIYNNAVPKYKKHFNNNLSHFFARLDATEESIKEVKSISKAIDLKFTELRTGLRK